MKYIKLLLITVFVSAVLISCGDDEWTGSGSAEVQFTDRETTMTVNENAVPLMSKPLTPIQIPISYQGEAFKFPFLVDIVVDVVSPAGLEEEDVMLITSKKLYFIKGKTEDADGNPIPMSGSTNLEFMPIDRPTADGDITVKLSITTDSSNGVVVGARNEYTITIKDVN